MIKPLIYRVLVKAEKFEEFSEDVKRAKSLGMVIPELEDHKRQQASVDRGTVVAIGETAFRDHNIECPIKIGDVVNYARFASKIIVDRVIRIATKAFAEEISRSYDLIPKGMGK